MLTNKGTIEKKIVLHICAKYYEKNQYLTVWILDKNGTWR